MALIGVVSLASLLLGVAVTSATQASHAAGVKAPPAPVASDVERPPVIDELPVPVVVSAPRAVQVCELPTVIEALGQGDDEGAVAAAGGGSMVRTAITQHRADCIDLSDPRSVWFVVNKQRPFPDPSWAPVDLVTPEGIRDLDGSSLDRTATAALLRMVEDAGEDGVGDMAIASAYRSYETQVANHSDQVAAQGGEADRSSARPGHSEHQTGFTADLVACDGGGCGGLDAFGASAQGRWVAENGWRYGWIVRYEPGQEKVTGYEPEPWHVRYIGPDLAEAYHEGGFRTLEAFFGLPAAPDYAD